MIAGETFDFWSLAVTRLLAVIVVVYSVSTLLTVWRKQPKGNTPPIIPRAVVTFAVGWLCSLGFITGGLVMSGAQAIESGPLRAIYGMSFIWSICGLAWIVSIGRQAYELEAASREVERQARKAKVPPCPEDEA